MRFYFQKPRNKNNFFLLLPLRTNSIYVCLYDNSYVFATVVHELSRHKIFLSNINWSWLFFFFIDINFRGDTHMTSTLWGVRGKGKNWMLLDIGGGGSKCS